MTIHRTAPALRPDTQEPALRRINSWLFWRSQDLKATQEQHDRETRWFRDQIANLTKERDEARARLLNTTIVMDR